MKESFQVFVMAERGRRQGLKDLSRREKEIISNVHAFFVEEKRRQRKIMRVMWLVAQQTLVVCRGGQSLTQSVKPRKNNTPAAPKERKNEVGQLLR